MFRISVITLEIPYMFSMQNKKQVQVIFSFLSKKVRSISLFMTQQQLFGLA